jgi:hypothetical protein
MQGFDRWEHVEPFHWLLRDFLSNSVRVFVVLDRDYRLDVEVEAVIARLEGAGVRPHVWLRKELESYLLEPSALARLSGLDVADVDDQLRRITAAIADDCRSQWLASYQRVYRPSGDSPATLLKRGFDELSPFLEDLTWRLRRFPPKQILAMFNETLQGRGLKALSAPRLATNLRRHEIADEIASLLDEVEAALR